MPLTAKWVKVYYKAEVSDIRPGGQSQSTKDSNLADWTALENVKENFITLNCIFISYTSFPADKGLHLFMLQSECLMQQLNDRTFLCFQYPL